MEVIDHTVLDFDLNSETNRHIIESINDGLTHYNQSQHPDPTEAPLTLSVQENGTLIGGLHGSHAYRWLRIDMLWVSDTYRGQGIGTALVAEAEKIGRERGCTAVQLDTYTFQAPDFYEKLGYEVFGVLPNYPKKNERIYFWKSLSSEEVADDA